MQYATNSLYRKLFIVFVCISMAAMSSLCFAADSAKATEKKIEQLKSKYTTKEILDKLDELWRGKSSKGKMSMKIKTAHYERSLSMRVFSLGKDHSLVKVLKPLKERNTATLKIGKEAYNYLPKTDRTIKLTSAMMMGSWLGSHFTNDDLVKESSYVDDYNSKVSFIGVRDKQEVIDVTAIPKPDAAVVWGKIVVTVRTSDLQPLYIVYYDEDGDEARKMVLSDHKKFSGRLMPARMKMVPSDKPKEFTEVLYEEMEFDIGLKKNFFSLNQLRR